MAIIDHLGQGARDAALDSLRRYCQSANAGPKQCTAAKSWRPGTELSEREALESRGGGQHPRSTSIAPNPILIIR
jgi:hypothetical protein